MSDDTQKAIGPSFPDELAAYSAVSLMGEHFTWFADGTLEFFDDTPQAVIDGVEAVYAAHDPSTPAMADLVAQRNDLMSVANAKTSGMSDAFVTGILNAQDTATFKAWAVYKLALSKLDLTRGAPVWPTPPA